MENLSSPVVVLLWDVVCCHIVGPALTQGSSSSLCSSPSLASIPSPLFFFSWESSCGCSGAGGCSGAVVGSGVPELEAEDWLERGTAIIVVGSNEATSFHDSDAFQVVRGQRGSLLHESLFFASLVFLHCTCSCYRLGGFLHGLSRCPHVCVIVNLGALLSATRPSTCSNLGAWFNDRSSCCCATHWRGRCIRHRSSYERGAGACKTKDFPHPAF